MALRDEHIGQFIAKYIKAGDVVSIGTSELGEKFVKKLALALEDKGETVKIVPTSARIAGLAAAMGLEITTLNKDEIDVAVEFADMVDGDFNFIKRDSHSLVRDKMIAQSGEVMVVVIEEENFVKKLKGVIPFEVAPFGHARTVMQLGKLGEASLRMNGKKEAMAESGNYLADVEVDEIYSLEDLEYQAKEIPGVLETGLFIGYADRVVLHGGDKVKVKSRMDYS